MYIKKYLGDGLGRSNNSRFFVMLAMVHKNFFMAFTSFFPLRKLAAEDLFLEKSALHRILWECHFYSLLYLDVLSLDAYHFCILHHLVLFFLLQNTNYGVG